MADELIDLVDEKNELTGEQKTWSEVHNKALLHRSVHIWIYNSKGEVLLQLRSEEKYTFPNLWDISCAGHVDLNEDPKTSALRELKEELGLTVDPQNLKFRNIEREQKSSGKFKENEFCYVYLLKFDGAASDLVLQKEEVQQVQFLTPQQIEKELKINPTNYAPHNYWPEILEEIQNAS
ncbi:MAG: NUDIX domain-containing protein [Candidatus Gracilibacteria bacterium]|jgi:isopentenyl-diphosphate delta-isomerase type 1